MVRVAVLYGGRSGEHDVSLCSAASVVSMLDKSKYEIIAIGVDRDGTWHVQNHPEIIEHKDFGKIMKLDKSSTWLLNHFDKKNKLVCYNIETEKKIEADIVFPVMHGTNCEDGTLQGLLQLAMVPFVGADAAGSVIGMDKDIAKRLLASSGIPVVDWVAIKNSEWIKNPKSILETVKNKIGIPLFVKPSNTGSSVGVVKVKKIDDLSAAIEFAFKYDNAILIEKAISAREIECAVLGNDQPEASILGEVIPKHEFYSYEAKYIDADGASLLIPADISEEISEQIKNCAVKAFSILNCCGMARVDFFLDKTNGNFYLNEINTLPGFTSISMFPKLWEYSGTGYSELLDILIELGFEKHRQRMKISTEI
jgi:D-alanine-D-alanine ligase